MEQGAKPRSAKVSFQPFQRPCELKVRPLPAVHKDPVFVATACFGDYDHPTVVELRRFRDLVLMETALGRRFISAYYRYGPLLASWVNRLPALKPAIRRALSAFVTIRGKTLKRRES
jgi:hypothetical protein